MAKNYRRKSARRSYSRRRHHLASAPGPSALYGLGQSNGLGEMSGAATLGIIVGTMAVLGVGGYLIYKFVRKDAASTSTTSKAAV